jgi:thiamine-phosphate pyrophosphorylase
MATPFRLPRFYPILDTAVAKQKNCPIPLLAHVLIDEGIKVLQYRHKEDWTQLHYDEAGDLKKLCQERGVLFVVNDRADFASLLGAALHVGQDDLPPPAARRILGDGILGFSTHNRAQLQRAAEEPIDYVALGPVYSTSSKLKPDPVVGVEGIAKLRPLSKKPMVAIGGITLQNAAPVLETGADSVAVIGGLFPESSDRDSLRARAAEWIAI